MGSNLLSPAQHLGLETGEKVLFVASTGGHLTQLHRFADMYQPDSASRWVTFDTAQSRSLLGSRRTAYVPYLKPRDVMGVVRNVMAIRKILRADQYDRVISTGAGLALSGFLAAKSLGVPTRYIESVSRVDGPSLTGRIVSRFRLAELYTQHPSWSSHQWRNHPSVLSQFRAKPSNTTKRRQESLKIFVTLGTIRPFRFDSAIDSLLRTGLVGESTIWQLGSTNRSDLPGITYDEMASSDFTRAAKEADVVVTHAGVGTILQLLEMGIHPVVLPRLKERGEHVDDHQLQITRLVSKLGVATAVEPSLLTKDHLMEAAGLATTSVGAQ